MVLAELVVHHSRAIAPTRRVALGRADLPMAHSPGFGGLLLAGIVADNLDGVPGEVLAEVPALIDDLERGRRIAQPRLRYRLQTDTHGLVRSTHRLVGRGQTVDFELSDHRSPLSQLLAAVYAAGRMPDQERRRALGLIRRSLRWSGAVGPAFVAWIAAGGGGVPAWAARGVGDPRVWALGMLGFGHGDAPDRSAITRRFRSAIRDAHPDHGADDDGAGELIRDLADARRILLGA